MKYTICIGNVMDGFSFIGVFNHYDDALEYAQDNVNIDNWSIAKIQPVH